MNVLVTGANGFIGKALCAEIVKKGWSLRGVVRSESYHENLPIGTDIVRVRSIGPDTDWSAALVNVETIVHLSARGHIMKETAADPLSQFRFVNTAGTYKLADSASKAGVHRLIYVSTVKVNGERTRGVPFTEYDDPAPVGPYAISKWEAEQALHEIAYRTDLETVVVRPPLVYGPGVKANFLHLLKIVERGLPLPFAIVKNFRSLIFLHNLIDVIITCITHPKAVGKTFMVSDGEDMSTPELIQRTASAIGKPSRLFPFPISLLRLLAKIAGKSEAVNRLLDSLTVDTSKIRTDLDWKPCCTIETGLRETAKWYLTEFR
jgi:nucleoside-diphosphate-sugar epimerase